MPAPNRSDEALTANAKEIRGAYEAVKIFVFRKWYAVRTLLNRGVAIFAKAFMGIPAQQAAKTTRPLMPAAAPAVLLHSLDTQQGVSNIVLAMTRRDFGKACIFTTQKDAS